jgi:hypothetical protein
MVKQQLQLKKSQEKRDQELADKNSIGLCLILISLRGSCI